MKSSIMVRGGSLLLTLLMIVLILPASVMATQPSVNPGTAATTTTTVDETAQTLTKTGESGDVLVISLIILGLSASLIVALKKSRRKARAVTLNSDYRIPNQRKE